MTNRYKKIGIKQAIHLDWLEKTLNLLEMGLDLEEIRGELKRYLQKKRFVVDKTKFYSKQTQNFVISNLLKTWVIPDKDLFNFRNALLDLQKKENSLAIHWAMISSAYPFWHFVAYYTGRLFKLQNEVSKKQILIRLKEQYGDRETISRYTDYVLKSFLEWGVLKEVDVNGVYIIGNQQEIAQPQTVVCLLESVLNCYHKKQFDYNSLLDSPSLFHFKYPDINLDQIEKYSNRIEINYFGNSRYFISLKNECE
ncbi:MAG TPA: hypothetical protein PLB99_11130 [Thermotogota bacterium]|nr:hypothetical protein [Thermotogota bacterium]